MSFKRNPNEMYMMPVNFGPCGGPRRRPDGRRWINDAPINDAHYAAVAVLEEPEQVQKLLPEGMILTDPYMSVGIDYLTNIAWLGGKEYALIAVTFPIQLESDEGILNGQYMSAIWENHIDPCITGREQLGYCKILCEINKPVEQGSEYILTASEYGNQFLKIKIDTGCAPQNPEIFGQSQSLKSDGMFHYKYMAHGETPYTTPDVHCICMAPSEFYFPNDYETPEQTPPDVKMGAGEFEFTALSWEQSPCHHKIIKCLSEIKIKEFLGGMIVKIPAYNDSYLQRVVKQYKV